MNWVIIITGLIPLWAALFIAFTNMKVLNADDILLELQEPEKETILEIDLTEDSPKTPEEEEKKGLFSGILGKIGKKEEKEEPYEGLEFTDGAISEDPQVMTTANLGLPKGIKKFWGGALVLVFLACLAYCSEIALDYAFKEYRWVIGTTNPWTSQLAFNTMATAVIAALGVMVATLKTGIHLIRN